MKPKWYQKLFKRNKQGRPKSEASIYAGLVKTNLQKYREEKYTRRPILLHLQGMDGPLHGKILGEDKGSLDMELAGGSFAMVNKNVIAYMQTIPKVKKTWEFDFPKGIR